MSGQPVIPSSPYLLTAADKITITSFLLLALLGGSFLALFGPVSGGLLILLMMGVSLFISKNIILYSGIFMALVVLGSIQLYYPQFGFIRWLTPLITGLLLIHIILERFQIRRSTLYIPPILRWALLFMITALLGSVINWGGGWNFIQGIKLYFQIWGLLFGLALINWDPKTLNRSLKLLFLIALIQILFVLHQYLIIAPEREGIDSLVAVDVVAGSFGAEYFGSGKNMVLSSYLITILAGLSALWREKAIKGYLLLFTLPFLLIPLFMNETKFALFLLLLVLVYVFRSDVIKKPLRFLLVVFIGLILTFGLLTSYSLQFGKGSSIKETALLTVESNVEDHPYSSIRLNRSSVLTFWAQQHGVDNITETVLGHGLGSAHESTESVVTSALSLATSRYDGYGIGYSSISSLLWDTGLLGTFMILAMFISAFLAARNLGKHFIGDSWQAGIFDGMQAALLVNVLLLFHNNYFVQDPVYQTIVYFVFGYIAFWRIRISEYQSSSMHSKIHKYGVQFKAG
jgi:hypothetical protein